MKNKKIIYLALFLLLIGLISFGFAPEEKDKSNRQNKVSTNDASNFIAINQCYMWVTNNGAGSSNPVDGNSGFFWPGGADAVNSGTQIAAIFADGLIWGAKVGREIRVNGSTYRYGLQAGKILPDGTGDDPSLAKYRVFKIRKGWEALPPGSDRDAFELDYNEWPVEDGAPWVDVDGDGIYTPGVDTPEFIGDEVLWFVSNDLDPARSTFTYGTLPMGLEVQTTVFGFNRTGDLGDMVFKKYVIINKGELTLNELILGYWSDTDLGDAGDDYTGCDTVLSLGYTYNGDNDDKNFYGVNPPANGYDFFQGPIVPGTPTDSAKFLGEVRHGYRNLPMTAFAFYINGSQTYEDPDLGVAAGSVQFYNYLNGLIWNGSPFIDPNTNEEVKFVLAGDPTAPQGSPEAGWNEWNGWPGTPSGGPGDRRHLIASGPFTMEPGDTQEVVIGILIARGTSNINSITELKRKDIAAQIAYDLDFQLTPSPPNPVTNEYTDNKKITLYWAKNAEDYDEGDPLIYGRGFDDTTYTFEGYSIYQFSDISGSDQKLIGRYDLENDVTQVTEKQTIGGVLVEVVLYTLPNIGITHYTTIIQDQIKNTPLVNGGPYYFAIAAFGYSPNSDPQVLESPPQVISYIPGRQPITTTTPYNNGDNIILEKTSGIGDGFAKLKVIDPTLLTGHTYAVEINKPGGTLSYDLINRTAGDTLLKNMTDFGTDSLFKTMTDGFITIVTNTGADGIANDGQIRSIQEIKGPGGNELSTSVSVIESNNSTGKWQVHAYDFRDVQIADNPSTVKNEALQALNVFGKVGLDDYEIRFTSAGSEYYTFAYTVLNAFTKNDPKGKDRVPFEIWNVGNSANPKSFRLFVKVADKVEADTNWTQKLFTHRWESFFAVLDTNGYSEPIPDPSVKSKNTDYLFGNLAIVGAMPGDVPAEGTVIKITTWRPLTDDDEFVGTATAPNSNDTESAKNNLDKITVFPNPYFGAHDLEQNKYQRFVRFTGLPNTATIRIISLSGVFIVRIEKNSTSQYVDWDLRNSDGLPVASGIYIAYLELPGIGTTILKLAIIQETQYLDRL